MATVEEIDRLTALLGRLTPLGRQQVGDLIEAQDWNLLVAGVIEVARAMLSISTAPVPHEHPDQVAIGWLDPRLRTLVEHGAVGDPAAVARVDALERSGARIQGALDHLAAQIGELRERARNVATRDLEREAAVNAVRRKIDGLADAREDVAEVRSTLESVRGRVSRAIELGEALQAGGDGVDLGVLKERVDGLEVLREGLTLPTGERLDAAALERRLAELGNTLVSQEELGAVLERPAVLDAAAEAALEGRLQAKLDTAMTEREDHLRADITSATDQKLARVDELVGQRVADATPVIREEVLATTRAELEVRGQQLLAQAGVDADGRIAASLQSVRADLAGGLDGLRVELGDRVAGELAVRLPAALDDLRGNLEVLRADLGQIAVRLESSIGDRAALDSRVTELDRRFGDRVGAIEGRTAAIDTRTAELDTRTAGLDTRTAALDTRLGVLDADVESRLERAVVSSAPIFRRLAFEAIDDRFGPR